MYKGFVPKDSKFHQGKFHPRNLEKYVGNANNIIYRSSWELKFLQWCDRDPNILKYGSEEIYIPYFDPVKKKIRKYYPDAFIEIMDSIGKKKKYLIEIKPERQTKPPEKKSRTTKSYLTEVYTYATNEAKWKAAKEFCDDHLMEFKIITEKQLF
jgi:hypothetical protein